MPPPDASPTPLRDAFLRDGIVVLDAAVARDVVDALAAHVGRELAAPCVRPESGTPATMRVDDPSTWPKGTARRVVEVVAPAEGADWDAVRRSEDVRRALNEILGDGRWEVELNKVRDGACEPRHWYCPVTFPEDDGEDGTLTKEQKIIRARLQRARQSEKRRKVSVDSGYCAPAPSQWTESDSANVRELRESGNDWETIARMISTGDVAWTAKQCEMHYEPAWAPEQDAKLLAELLEHGEKWNHMLRVMQPMRPGCTKKHVRARALMLLDEHSANLVKEETPVRSSVDASTSWHPVNRRRMLNRGWHLDIGAGFSTDATRSPEGHPFQGVIILVLLTDCAAGGGGTAFIKGSHRWVASHLRRQGGMVHRDLNTWAIDLVGELSSRGRLPLSYQMDERALDNPENIDGVIEQVVGKAGTVALLHPWMIHSGTSNLSENVRILANGMARVTQESFEADGIPILREVESVDPKVERTLSFMPSTKPEEQQCRPQTDSTLPSVSVILPVHNAARWLNETLSSVCAQTYRGPIEVSIFDDGSTDESSAILRRWMSHLERVGLSVTVNGSRWSESAHFVSAAAPNRGIGFCRNRCIEQSRGQVLIFLDSDDVMMPQRIEMQVPLAMNNPTAIIGGCWKRYPSGSTEHYEAWANMMTQKELHLEQFRECTLLLPTWCMKRSLADAVGPFVEAPPGSGEAEDLIFFQKFLELYYSQNCEQDLPSLLRAGDYPNNPILLYRWSPQSASARCSRRRLLQVRTQAFEERILSQPEWKQFLVWGAGRDAKNFMNELSPSARKRVVAMIDIDPRKTGRFYSNSQLDDHLKVPIVHFTKAPRGIPVIVCVAKRRKGSGEAGDLEANVDTLGLVDGSTLWYLN